jgi:hypothetical protein
MTSHLIYREGVVQVIVTKLFQALLSFLKLRFSFELKMLKTKTQLSRIEKSSALVGLQEDAARGQCYRTLFIVTKE